MISDMRAGVDNRRNLMFHFKAKISVLDRRIHNSESLLIRIVKLQNCGQLMLNITGRKPFAYKYLKFALYLYI